MLDEFIAAVREEMAIIVGLIIGAIAHYGTRVREGEKITWREVLGFAMQLGFIGLMAALVTEQIAAKGVLKTTIAAILAVSANEVIQWAKRNGWMRFMPDSRIEERRNEDA